MKLTPDQLRMNAAAMLSLADGKPIETKIHEAGDSWFVVQAPEKIDWNQFEYRPKPAWKLPDPPTGHQWHRTDWREEMLPKGWRPLLAGEARENADEWTYDGGKWRDVAVFGPAGSIMDNQESPHRTHRPLPPVSRPWSRPEDVPGPVCWVRNGDSDFESMILAIKDAGIFISGHTKQDWLPWDLLTRHSGQYSTDRKTWHKCEVLDEDSQPSTNNDQPGPGLQV